MDLATALAETVLHDAMPQHGRFVASRADLQSRFVVRFATTTKLVLADLTGAALRRLGLDGAISTVVPPDVPRRWSRAIHRHPQQVDGIRYMSRNLNDRLAVVVFDRAQAKLGVATVQPLLGVPGIWEELARLHICVELP